MGCLDFFGEYFAAPYPLPKMDMIAVPDFSAGAMENWGLVVYRASLMLFQEGKTPVNAKQQIGYVVGHELAHQWFGNLVTMEWWSQLWLNEGFATWVGWRAMDHLHPEWRVWSQFLTNEQATGLGLDSLRSSHPVEVPIQSAGQVSEIFDAISYSKGSCVIRMLESYVGEDTFRAGMRLYVARHAYGNAGTADLWAALSEASGLDVGGLMSCWTSQTGYPLLSVATDAAAGTVTVSQQRYLAAGPGGLTAEEAATLWKVPLRAPGLAGTLDAPAATMPLPAVGGALKLNVGQSGFYRTVYDDAARGALMTALPGLAEVDRVGLVSDAFACGAAGYSDTTAALELLHAYSDSHEESFVVWAEIAAGLGSLSSAFFEQPEEVVTALQSFGVALYAPIVQRLGWEARPGDDYQTVRLRQLAISRSLALEDPAAAAEARRRYDAHRADPTGDAIPADLKAGGSLRTMTRTRSERD